MRSLVIALILVGATFAQTTVKEHGKVLPPSSNERHTEANFKGSDVKLDLGVGEFEVVPGASDKVVVVWWGKTADEAHARVETTGSVATVHAGSDRHNNADVHFRIELPRRADIVANAKVGEVRIGGFNGDLSAEIGVGELSVRVLNPSEYGAVTASVGVGDVSAGPFEAAAKRSHLVGAKLEYRGSGARRLTLHVGTGEVRIEEGGAGAAI